MSGSCITKKLAIYINKCGCYFLSENKVLVSIAIQVISCNLEDYIILVFISVPLSDRNIPYMGKECILLITTVLTLTNTSCM